MSRAAARRLTPVPAGAYAAGRPDRQEASPVEQGAITRLLLQWSDGDRQAADALLLRLARTTQPS